MDLTRISGIPMPNATDLCDAAAGRGLVRRLYNLSLSFDLVVVVVFAILASAAAAAATSSSSINPFFACAADRSQNLNQNSH